MRFDFGSGDTESDSAESQVRAAAIDAARSQGGTELAGEVPGGVIGKNEEFPIEDDRTNCNPMGYNWELSREEYDMPCCDDD